MNRRMTALGILGLGASLITTLAAGCDTARPGGGVLNNDPASLESNEKPATRTDFQMPPVDSGDASLADSAATSPSGDRERCRDRRAWCRPEGKSGCLHRARRIAFARGDGREPARHPSHD